MDHLRSSLPLIAVLTCCLSLTFAQNDQVLSTFIYVNHGERTPMVWIDDPSLTPYGATQLYQAGAQLRRRYVQDTAFGFEESYQVREISSIFLKNRQVSILSSNDEWVTGSAQAFMQGLYPPLTNGQNYTIIQGESDFWNGTNVIAPLGGYQYPNVESVSSNDLDSIVVKGTENCPHYATAMLDYTNSSRFLTAQQSSQAFYDSLYTPFLEGVFDPSTVGYEYAWYIWDYLSYAYDHNTTVRQKLSIGDYTRAKILADDWMLDMYSNTTNGQVGPNHIRAVAGRTLAHYVTQQFLSSIQTKGQFNKINLVFGDYKPMMSFAALAQLMKDSTGEFYIAPAPGASIMFELFSQQTDTTSYPKMSDMYVRFFYQDGNSTDPVEYALFGRSPSVATMSYAEFTSAMSTISLSGVQDWCQTCGSSSIFCLADSESTSPDVADKHHGLSAAVAGVIGAVVALAFVALLVGILMLIGGVRFYRRGKRTSQLGGFKGNEKLASDRDLTLPKGGAGVTVNEQPRGHERVGSWELKEPGRTPNIHSGIDTTALGARSHGLDHDDTTVDPYGVPVKPRDTF